MTIAKYPREYSERVSNYMHHHHGIARSYYMMSRQELLQSSQLLATEDTQTAMWYQRQHALDVQRNDNTIRSRR